MNRLLLTAAAAAALLGGPAAVAREARDGWFVTAYAGLWYADGTPWGFFPPDFEDSGLAVLAVGKDVGGLGDHVRVEVEGLVGKHFGEQDHVEFDGAVLFRWLPFPWDGFVDTSFAVGEGLSYATEAPALEEELNGEEGTARLLNYLTFELAFALPEEPAWSGVVRLHHRSGIFGLFDGVRGASDFLAAGVRHRF